MTAKWLLTGVTYQLKMLHPLRLSDNRLNAKGFTYDFNRKIQPLPPQMLNEKIASHMLINRNQCINALTTTLNAQRFITRQMGDKYVIPPLDIYPRFRPDKF
ncbi:hypothetical protein DBV23_16265 [Edwardsiella ictaluri]|uniref:Uncharacterized protein n=2 Tax=Edwardsiella ictaluri TaxID=67780 RepID=C5BFS5_EDWI9|nr:hypothetical protein [Edwardsiella ictaluri]ACR69352.1 hypothetical protein NT01EI_2177 [Edwardsiella ictaluri 93-146]AVZ83613.1 hypothetical protein DBV23_16265 [Edwardsiella ictaluri]EKS7764406.1 hypothetical protein [Edwardsiella ictaluri]EKS7771303.1 hypothetical protein [Edwardsiella ictaluri]EKS7774392.1 hypothetical protein [Edwardsiella ictaluri]